MTFKPVTLNDFCPSITYNFEIAYLNSSHLVNFLIVSFYGKYRDGSAGRSDAGLIKGITVAGVKTFCPFRVVVNLSDLEYNWGDDLDLDLSEFMYQDYAIVVGEKCRKAISTLHFGLTTDEDIVDNKMYFGEIDTAIKFLTTKSAA